jgi:hypothetical protein
MLDWRKRQVAFFKGLGRVGKQCHAAADFAAAICVARGRSGQIYSSFSRDFRATWNRSHKTVKFM